MSLLARPDLNPVRPELVEGPCANFIDASTSSARTELDSARTVLDVVGFSLAMAKTYQRAGAVGKPVGSQFPPPIATILGGSDSLPLGAPLAAHDQADRDQQLQRAVEQQREQHHVANRIGLSDHRGE